jgi:hypothetical protein
MIVFEARVYHNQRRRKFTRYLSVLRLQIIIIEKVGNRGILTFRRYFSFRTSVFLQKIITFRIKISDVRNKKNTGVRNDHRKKTDVRNDRDETSGGRLFTRF